MSPENRTEPSLLSLPHNLGISTMVRMQNELRRVFEAAQKKFLLLDRGQNTGRNKKLKHAKHHEAVEHDATMMISMTSVWNFPWELVDTSANQPKTP